MGLYEDIIYLRNYSRWIPELSRRELYWSETADRFFNFIFNETVNHKLIPEKVKRKIKEYVLKQEVLPSMRLLWSAGVNAKRDNIAAYNCSAMGVKDLGCFGEMMLILLAGAGAGYSVEYRFINQLPVVEEQDDLRSPTTFIIPDSRVGWKQAVDYGIHSWFAGYDVMFDYSKIRPAGSPLITSGGYASGHQALKDCLDFVKTTILNAQNRQLTSLEVSDIMNEIAASVVCGGVRRSSQICLVDPDDELMLTSKHGDLSDVVRARRAMANISLVYRDRPDYKTFSKQFMEMLESKTGEPGIFNLAAARKRTPPRRDSKNIVLSNPCFRGDMRLLTPEGYVCFHDLVGQESIDIINASGDVVRGRVWCSGEKSLVRIGFFGQSSMSNIFCTANHIFKLSDGATCEAKDLVGKQLMPFINVKQIFDKEAFLAGFIQGDGCTSRLNSQTHRGLEVRFGEKDADIAAMFDTSLGVWYSREAYRVATNFNLESAVLPERKLPPLAKLSPSFFSGLFSANGSVITKYRVALKSTCYDMLSSLKEALKDQFNIEAYITTNKPTQVEFSNGTYLCKESYDLNISQYKSLLTFASEISFGQVYKQQALKDLIIFRAPRVRSVKDAGNALVYDFNEPETNWGVVEGMVVHNCGETLLRDKGLCNLSSVIIRANDTKETVMDKVKTATWLGILQSTLTYFPNLSDEWVFNAEDERLLGVSLSALCDNFDLITAENLKAWKSSAVNTASKASKLMDINMPAAITLGKPDGNTSQLVNGASGLHARWSPYYIRRIRIHVYDPLFKLMVDQGMTWEPCAYSKDTAVLSFPIKSPEGAKFRNGDTAIQQLDWYRHVVSNWAEQNISTTTYVRDEEWQEVTDYVYNHFDEITGVTFFPYDNSKYVQAPYEEIDEATYERLRAVMPDIDFSKLPQYEKRDTTEGGKVLACSGGACEL